jgi:hypothetical protein
MNYGAKINLAKLPGYAKIQSKSGKPVIVIDPGKADIFLSEKGNAFLDVVVFTSEEADEFNQYGAIAKSKKKDDTGPNIYLANLSKLGGEQKPEQDKEVANNVEPNDLPF